MSETKFDIVLGWSALPTRRVGHDAMMLVF